MKQRISSFLIVTVVLALFSGCGALQPVPAERETAASAAAEETTVQISTTDEFLAALGSDREVSLNPGTYDLCTASDFKKNPRNSAYSWDNSTGTLILSDLQNLTIHGEGAELLGEVLDAGVLSLVNCKNITIEGLSVRHRAAPKGYYILQLKGCENISLHGLSFSDAPRYQLDMTDSQNIQVTETEFTGAAPAAVLIRGSREVRMEDCRIHGLSAETKENLPGMPDLAALINIGSTETGQSKDVHISRCRFTDNRSGLLFHIQDARKIYIENNTFSGNEAREAAFCFWSSAPHMVGNAFEDNAPWAWYYPYSDLAVDETGADLQAAEFASVIPIPEAGPQKEVHVSNADEFLAAIAPDTKIILDCALLDLSTASDYGTGKGSWYFWEQQYDGPVLTITQVNNLTISSPDTDRTAHTISAVPRYADVLVFKFCTNLSLENITCGHTVEPGYCMGGVLRFQECRNTTVQNCGLYGCGILGIIAHGGEALRVADCEIYECSDGGVSLVDVNGVQINGTAFRDLGGPELHVRNCKDATIDGRPMEQAS